MSKSDSFVADIIWPNLGQTIHDLHMNKSIYHYGSQSKANVVITYVLCATFSVRENSNVFSQTVSQVDNLVTCFFFCGVKKNVNSNTLWSKTPKNMTTSNKMVVCPCCDEVTLEDMVECPICLRSVCRRSCQAICDTCHKKVCMDDMDQCFYCSRPVCHTCQDAQTDPTWTRPECCTEKLLCPDCMNRHQPGSCVSCADEDLCVDDVYTCCCGQTFCIECANKDTNETCEFCTSK